MDWDTYKELSHSPEFFTRWALETTSRYVHGSLKGILIECARIQPLEKPADHKGGSETDVLRLDLDNATVRSIIDSLVDEAIKAKLEEGSAQPNFNPLIRSWEEYGEWLKE